MRWSALVVALSMTVLSLPRSARAAPKPAPAAIKAVPKKVTHRFLATDNRNHQVVIVGRDGKIQWRYPETGVCNDAWLLANGNVLLAGRNDAVRQVVPDLKSGVGGKTVWKYAVPRGCEVHTCQPLGEGKVLVGQCGKPAKLLEIDRAGKVVKMIVMSSGPGVHGQMRHARKTARGTYLVAMNSQRQVIEIDAAGKTVRTIKVPGNPFAVVALGGGNTLISCGNGHKLVEVDAGGTIVWQIGETDLAGQPLRFVAGVHRLANGNTVVCNWDGYKTMGAQPQIFEVTRDKKVVWQVFDSARFKALSSVQIIDAPADPTGGGVLR